jgi:hypothetical protein
MYIMKVLRALYLIAVASSALKASAQEGSGITGLGGDTLSPTSSPIAAPPIPAPHSFPPVNSPSPSLSPNRPPIPLTTNTAQADTGGIIAGVVSGLGLLSAGTLAYLNREELKKVIKRLREKGVKFSVSKVNGNNTLTPFRSNEPENVDAPANRERAQIQTPNAINITPARPRGGSRS